MYDKTEFKLKAWPDQGDEGRVGEKRPCLIMINGDSIGHVYILENDETTIGRDDNVELVLSSTGISRKHARITAQVDGFYFSDLGSTNGCMVNENRVTKPTKLEEGDKIALDDVVLKFSYQDKDDAQYHEKLRNLAIKDGLTHVYNKHYFSEVLEKEFHFCQHHKSGLALVLFDIDHFKQVNDNCGHPAGDFVLKHLAQLIEEGTRDYDVFARYGGEEFAFLLRSETLELAIEFAERVRVDIENRTFVYNDLNLNVTASFGVTWWSGDDSINAAGFLVEAADKHLYKAKNDGRNCVRHD